MASELLTLPREDSVSDLLFVKTYVKTLFRRETRYRGYRRDYLSRNLSEMEETFLICKVCSGIMREASLVRGETTCLLCSATPRKLNAVNVIQNSVAKLEIKCPVIRECEWKGNISEAEEHLKDCDNFLIKCTPCAQIFPRRGKGNHDNKLCPMRRIYCKYSCVKSGYARDLAKHERFCTKFPVLCQNGCGEEFERSFISKHRSVCELEEVTCPFAEYGCEARAMLRRDLLVHKRERYIEHSDMSLCRINFLERKIMTMKQMNGVEWKIHLKDIAEDKLTESPAFYINNYKLRLYVISGIFFISLICCELEFSIERIEGEFGKQLGKACITHYRVITVNNQDITKPLYEEGTMNYQLNNGEKGEFYRMDNSVCEKYSAGDNPLILQFYFDINAHPILTSSVVTCSSIKTAQQEDRDPFSYRTT